MNRKITTVSAMFATVATALLLEAVPAAALVGSWSTPVDVSSSGQSAANSQVTVDSTGLAIAVWDRSDGGNTVIQSSTSQDGGAWSTPVDVSLTGENAFNPQVTVDSTGLAIAVWQRWIGSNFIIQSSTSLDGGTWSNPVNVSLPGGSAGGAQVVVDSAGLATAVWARWNGSEHIVQSSTSLDGGTWSTPVDVSLPGGGTGNLQVTVDSAGLVTAVWYRSDGSDNIIQSSYSLDGGTWSIPVDVSLPGESASQPQLTVDSTGLVTAVWYRYNGTNYIVQSSTSLDGGTWSTPVNVSLPGQHASNSQVTVDPTGLATAVWHRYNGSINVIQSSTSLDGGTWTTPVDVSLIGGSAGEAEVTVDSTGLVTAVWYRSNGVNTIIQSSTSLDGGSWSTPVDVSLPGGNAYRPLVAVDSAGLVTAVWYRSNGSHDVFQSSNLSNPISAELADTGVEVEWLPFGALLAVVAGVGFVTRGRFTRTP